jgi:hypothetical protein
MALVPTQTLTQRLRRFFPWGVTLPAHSCLVPGLRMCEIILPLFLTSSWGGAIVRKENGTLTATVMWISEIEWHLLPKFCDLLCTVKQNGSLMNFMLSIQLGGSDFVWRLSYRFYMDPVRMLRMRKQPKEWNIRAIACKVNIVVI